MQNAILTLEFDQLKGMLLQRIRTPLGATIVEALEITDNAERLVRELRRTSEGVVYLRQGTALDLHDLPDPRPALGKLNVADGWRTGVGIDKGARFAPSELGPIVRDLLAKAPPVQKVYGT